MRQKQRQKHTRTRHKDQEQRPSSSCRLKRGCERRDRCSNSEQYGGLDEPTLHGDPCFPAPLEFRTQDQLGIERQREQGLARFGIERTQNDPCSTGHVHGAREQRTHPYIGNDPSDLATRRVVVYRERHAHGIGPVARRRG